MKLDETRDLIRGEVRMLKAYHLEPETCEVKLNQNENPYDWPEPIKREMARFCAERPWNRYPPFIPDALKEALADYAGTRPQGIMVGNGSNEMLLVLLLSLAGPGTPVIYCQPTFTVYRLLAEGLAAKPVPVPLDAGLRFDLPKLNEALRENRGGVLILCSPNNPTGSVIDEIELREILSIHTGFCILDQAYVEFGGYDAMPLLGEFPNLVITRTFSKAFAGAGLRLGYLAGNPAMVEEFNKIKLPYNINFFSEHAARLLLKNRGLVRERLDSIIAERNDLFISLQTFPLKDVYPSAANFILVRYHEKQRLFDGLKSDGVLVRDVSSYPMLENCLRISIGSPEENLLLKKALQKFFAL